MTASNSGNIYTANHRYRVIHSELLFFRTIASLKCATNVPRINFGGRNSKHELEKGGGNFPIRCQKRGEMIAHSFRREFSVCRDQNYFFLCMQVQNQKITYFEHPLIVAFTSCCF